LTPKWAVSVAALSMLLGAGAGAYAASNMTEIKAYLNGNIQFKLNGQPVQPRDNGGNVVAPISYNGTTYLPVRAVAGLLGVAIDYDAATSTVLLGEKPDGVSIADGFDSMYRTKDPGKTTYNGKDCKDVYFDDGDGNRSSNFILKPNKSCICRSRRSAKTSGKLQYTRRTTETRRS